jgi:hypothetical protein
MSTSRAFRVQLRNRLGQQSGVVMRVAIKGKGKGKMGRRRKLVITLASLHSLANSDFVRRINRIINLQATWDGVLRELRAPVCGVRPLRVPGRTR